MKKLLATAVVALFCTLGAQAQTDKNTTAKDAVHHCLMQADDNTWATLGLSADQKTKVKDLQAKCKAEMADKTMDAKAGMGKHEQELQAVLTPEQLEKWNKWCAGQPADGKAMEKK